MSAAWLVSYIVGTLLLPPVGLVLAALAGWLLRKRAPRLGFLLCIGSLLLLLVLSTAAGARLLAAPLERRSMPPAAPRSVGAQAIVILGGGSIKNAPEYGGQDMPGLNALARLRYGARLHRETGLPILVSGGMPDGSAESEAAIMARTLREDFQVPVKWIEQASNNTVQNAQFSARLLEPHRIRRILLVTDALHMPRAQAAFMQAGLQVVPAPTSSFSRSALAPIDFLPNGPGLTLSRDALHEWIGLYWYRVRYGTQLESSAPAPDNQ